MMTSGRAFLRTSMLCVLLLGSPLYLTACESYEQSDALSAEERAQQLGQRVYTLYCTTCHQSRGQGVPNAYPPLRGTAWVNGDEGRLIRLILHGVRGRMEVEGEVYDNSMLPHGHLSDEQVAAVLTFIRQNFGNDAPAVTRDQVAAVRAAEDRDREWEAHVLWEQTGVPEE